MAFGLPQTCNALCKVIWVNLVLHRIQAELPDIGHRLQRTIYEAM